VHRSKPISKIKKIPRKKERNKKPEKNEMSAEFTWSAGHQRSSQRLRHVSNINGIRKRRDEKKERKMAD
jgi:hypothetical protein